MNLNIISKKTVRVIAYSLIFTLLFATFAFAKSASKGGSVSVKGYYRKDGTYVRPHMRSAPDGNFNNNWNTKGNINPYTGKEGTRVTPPSTHKGSGGQKAPSALDKVESNLELDDGEQRLIY